jgi:hypothetical protein
LYFMFYWLRYFTHLYFVFYWLRFLTDEEMEEVDRSIDSIVRGSTRGRQTRRSSRGGRVGRPPGVRRGTKTVGRGKMGHLNWGQMGHVQARPRRWSLGSPLSCSVLAL